MDISKKHSQRLKDLERKTKVNVQFAAMNPHKRVREHGRSAGLSSTCRNTSHCSQQCKEGDKSSETLQDGSLEKGRMNKRIRALSDQIERATQARDQLIKELEKRGGNPHFVIAQALFQEGWRLKNWGAPLTDTFNEIRLSLNGKERGYWADGANRNTSTAAGIIGLPADEAWDEILDFLSDLTEEEEQEQ